MLPSLQRAHPQRVHPLRKCVRVAVIPSISGVSASANVAPAPFTPCVPRLLPVLFVMAAPWSGPMERLVLVDPILGPTTESPLLSSQIQQRPGHLLEEPSDATT